MYCSGWTSAALRFRRWCRWNSFALHLNANKMAREFTEASLEDIQNGKWIEYLHPEDRGLVSREFAKVLATGNSCGAAYRLYIDGIWRWVLSRAEPSRDNHGNIGRWFGVILDIRYGKAAERKLRESCGRTSLERHARGLCLRYRHLSHKN
jgi:PAS domain S-box-containing protein